MSVTCITCDRFTLKKSALAKSGFGNCPLQAVHEQTSALFERDCARHVPAKPAQAEAGRAWLAKHAAKAPEAAPPAPVLAEAPARATIGEKAAYVRGQRQTRDHECHWPGCARQVPPALWGCMPHWQRLPKALQSKVFATYHPGQEKTLTPSREYLAVANEVQAWIREHGGPA